MARNTYVQQLEEYFDKTSLEQQEKDYNDLREFNQVGPTVDEYIQQLEGLFEMHLVEQPIMNPEFSLDFLLLMLYHINYGEKCKQGGIFITRL